jgi:hypothetical protein
LEDPFSHFDRIKAKFAYEHSLYLIYTIETHFGGQEALQKLVGHVNQTNRLDSNELLGSIDISFQELHEKARGLWQQRISLVPQSL